MNLTNVTNKKDSSRELLIIDVIDKDTLNNNQLTLFLCFTFIWLFKGR